MTAACSSKHHQVPAQQPGHRAASLLLVCKGTKQGRGGMYVFNMLAHFESLFQTHVSPFMQNMSLLFSVSSVSFQNAVFLWHEEIKIWGGEGKWYKKQLSLVAGYCNALRNNQTILFKKGATSADMHKVFTAPINMTGNLPGRTPVSVKD